jgi:uncharacterized membrane protein YeaQ/YmgE (transglycosylase-associated protein family)
VDVQSLIIFLAIGAVVGAVVMLLVVGLIKKA